jgi:NADH dehydrogenase
MKKYRRCSLIGLIAGGISSSILIATSVSPHHILTGLVCGVFVGWIYALGIRTVTRTSRENILIAATMGIVLWIGLSVILLPLFAGLNPQWTPEGMRRLFSSLVGWIVYSVSIGLLTPLLRKVLHSLWGPEYQPVPPERTITTRIVIIGGGFAGVTTAKYLEKNVGADPTIELVLISETNALLFTPMLAEVAGGGLEPPHISVPLRTSLHRTRIIHGRVVQIAVEQRHVLIEQDHTSQMLAQPFDYLVLAIGSISNYLGLEGVKETAFDFKSLADAIRIKEHIIRMLEFADRERDTQRRQAMLTFVIAGGGFAGAELAGAINDLARGARPYYPSISTEEIQIIVVHSRERILPELSATLATYAMQRMQERGVTFYLNTRLISATEGTVLLHPENVIRTETLIWTAGIKPHPLLQTLPAICDKRGAILVDRYLAVPNLPGFWALGDCALVTDAKTDLPCPPTAQFALREAATLADNIYASIHQRPRKPFHFSAIGVLCVVGYQRACAEIKTVRFSGLFAWLLWRGIYLSKLPSFERKLRVCSDWIIELFFPRDLVQTIEIEPMHKPNHLTGETFHHVE